MQLHMMQNMITPIILKLTDNKYKINSINGRRISLIIILFQKIIIITRKNMSLLHQRHHKRNNKLLNMRINI